MSNNAVLDSPKSELILRNSVSQGDWFIISFSSLTYLSIASSCGENLRFDTHLTF
jgi:hypothetical protein